MDDSSKSNPPPPPPPTELEEQEIPEPSFGSPSVVYMQILFWMASYVQQRSAHTGMSEEQLIEEFGMNLRKTINPQWRPQG